MFLPKVILGVFYIPVSHPYPGVAWVQYKIGKIKKDGCQAKDNLFYISLPYFKPHE